MLNSIQFNLGVYAPVIVTRLLLAPPDDLAGWNYGGITVWNYGASLLNGITVGITVPGITQELRCRNYGNYGAGITVPVY